MINSHNQAVSAAKKGDWQEAININSQLIAENPKNTAALNRLGMAYLQIKENKKAISVFKTVLDIDKNNQIAKKNLQRIQSKNTHVLPSFSQPHFIEEPGKTRVVELHRLADKGCLNSFATGTPCQLKCKKRYISVEIDGKYIGALPEDISFRLSRLIEKGNQYSCYLHATSKKNCSIYLKETHRSAKNQDINSFPINRQNNEGEENNIMLEDSIPVEIVDDQEKEEADSEADQERTLNF